jgi:hypothetical protein
MINARLFSRQAAQVANQRLIDDELLSATVIRSAARCSRSLNLALPAMAAAFA